MRCPQKGLLNISKQIHRHRLCICEQIDPPLGLPGNAIVTITCKYIKKTVQTIGPEVFGQENLRSWEAGVAPMSWSPFELSAVKGDT
eukprot:scaffold383683_cov15-Prasinocladus_malaysianus.AAC.1